MTRVLSTTIDFPDAIENLNFDETGLLVMTTQKALYHLPYASIEPKPAGAWKRACEGLKGTSDPRRWTNPLGTGPVEEGNVWSCPDFGTIGLGENCPVVSNRGYWKAVVSPAHDRIKEQFVSVTSNGVDMGDEPRRVFEGIESLHSLPGWPSSFLTGMRAHKSTASRTAHQSSLDRWLISVGSWTDS